jgi:hypothetical protein
LCAGFELAEAQPVEYVKVCDAYATGFYYIPGTDTCLKIGGKYDWKELPPGASTPAPPAGCANCAELDKEIARLTDQFNKLEGKGVPKWQEDIASDLANLRERKAACAKICTPPPMRTTQNNDGGAAVCSQYGAGFFYIPGTDVCLKISHRTHVSEKVPENVKAPPPPAGCSSCAALDVEISKLQQERAEWAAKKNATFVADVDSQIAKLAALKAGCQRTCQRTAEKPKPQKPLQTFIPPSRAKGPPGTNPGYRPDGALH